MLFEVRYHSPKFLHICSMLIFPSAKINLGLEVTSRRSDGYHDISSVFYPIALSDALEFVAQDSGADSYHYSGIPIPGPTDGNLCAKALYMMRQEVDIPFLQVFLHKAIPMGAGLGGGSSDAAFFLKALNDHFKAGFSNDRLRSMGAKIGSDVPFFIDNVPALAEGRGEILTQVASSLTGYHLVLVAPDIHISTAEAYAQVQVKPTLRSPADVVSKLPVSQWKDHLYNRFEKYAIRRFPEIGVIRDKLYDLGADYASMTGSGSAVYGIFKTKPESSTEKAFANAFVYQGIF